MPATSHEACLLPAALLSALLWRAVNTSTLRLTTSDGCVLAADLAVPVGAIDAAALVCHPHPLYGGDRHNGVVDAVFQALPAHRVAALRFDFRGVGTSTGSHGGGVDEVADVVAAIDALHSLVSPDGLPMPVFAVGYSFGSAVALRCLDERIRGWVAIAPPLAMLDVSVGSDERPKFLLVPEHDQFTPPAAVTEATGRWRATEATVVPGADHFLGGRTRFVAQEAAERITAWIG